MILIMMNNVTSASTRFSPLIFTASIYRHCCRAAAETETAAMYLH